ncbi:hypothetical protein [Enterococcus mundtii]|uniref:hypothetical protein n=1 Tax=Enterococcus mundtii TaxID=53346 RepID=UPI00032F2274|nr:hypothetical protein [Enterococcus mundtii]EOH58861.1 hypothetical protein UAC_03000 [Enterococcus mundtii ATCC 882]EOU13636.1 hypothetical protein I587_02190 [Enterococcus mundtii ATCC 882]PJK26554.1 hypothetical protein CV769_04275 [Enterococcus mundtii]
MIKDEYVEVVKLTMEKQDMYLMWFLGLLSIILVFVGVLQWRLSSKQISQLKEETKKEARKEILSELKEDYQINLIPSMKESILRNEQEIMDVHLKVQINSINQKGSFEAESVGLLSKLNASEKDIEQELLFFVSKYFNFLTSNEDCIYFFSKKLAESHIISKIDNSNENWKYLEFYLKGFRESCQDDSLFNFLN